MKFFSFLKSQKKEVKENNFVSAFEKRRDEIELCKKILGEKYLCAPCNFIKKRI